jgi:uncharacterized membrane protein YuzA (DUF378 family)
MAMNETETRMRPTASLSSARPVAAMNPLDWIALILMIVGGLNWALVGLFNFDLVAAIFGQMTTLSRGVYILVGVAAIYGIVMLIRLGSMRRAI